uniref:Uncharacterized protein n=1 Tax=Lactuca sativa TaxID=4236 RepID=A0A9R1WW05_LACSA|nr:hypothetical protein LSAT_V11C900472710 [Lactuca sativa]
MEGKISGAILNYLIVCTRTLFDHIYFSWRLTTVLTPYVEMVLHKRMQKSVQSELSYMFMWDMVQYSITCDHAIATSHRSNIHELPDMVQIYYQGDVFQTAYQT